MSDKKRYPGKRSLSLVTLLVLLGFGGVVGLDSLFS